MTIAFSSIKRYLHRENKTFHPLLAQLKQLQTWNDALKATLGTDSALSCHCQVIRKIDNVLLIITDNPHWQMRLRCQIPTLLIKMRKYPGLEHLKALCCKVHPAYTPFTPAPLRSPQEKLSPKTATLIKTTASKINHAKLKAVLEKIASRGGG